MKSLYKNIARIIVCVAVLAIGFTSGGNINHAQAACEITDVNFGISQNTIRGSVPHQVRDNSEKFATIEVKTNGEDCVGQQIEVWLEPFAKDSFDKIDEKTSSILAISTSSQQKTGVTPSITIEKPEGVTMFYKPGFHPSCSAYSNGLKTVSIFGISLGLTPSFDNIPKVLKAFNTTLYEGWESMKEQDLFIEKTDVILCGFVAAAQISSEGENKDKTVYSLKPWRETDREKAKSLKKATPQNYIAYGCFSGFSMGDIPGIQLNPAYQIQRLVFGESEGFTKEASCNNEWKWIGQQLAQQGITDGPCAGKENCQPILAGASLLGSTDGTLDVGGGFTIGPLVTSIFRIVIGFGSLFAVVVFVYAGYLYLTPIAKNKLQGKTMITNVFVGILILSSIYLMLNTINPDLLSVEVDQGIKNVSLEGTVFLDEETYYSVTGERKKSPEEYAAMARKAADELNIDYCIYEAIFALESLSNPAAIGQDENVSGTKSNRALKKANKTYHGKAVTNGVNDNKETIKKQIKQSHMGIDWRFSQGIGLMQVTIFPKDFWDTEKYLKWVVTDAAYNKRKTPGSRVVNSRRYTGRSLLKAEANIKAGGDIWLEFYKQCKDVAKALGAYNSGSCDRAGHNDYRSRAMAKYNACCQEEQCTLQ